MRPAHHGNQRYQRIGRKHYKIIAACTCRRCQHRRRLQVNS